MCLCGNDEDVDDEEMTVGLEYDEIESMEQAKERRRKVCESELI